MGGIDWEALRAAAREAMTRAYAPYSRFPVGVAGLVDDGRLVTGCNVENASYGLSLCAECGMVSDLARTGGRRIGHERGIRLIVGDQCDRVVDRVGGRGLDALEVGDG